MQFVEFQKKLRAIQKADVEDMKAIDPDTFKEFFGNDDGLTQESFDANLKDFIWNEFDHVQLVFLYARTTDLPSSEIDDLISKMQSYFPSKVFDKVSGLRDQTDCPQGDFFSQAESFETLTKEQELYDELQMGEEQFLEDDTPSEEKYEL